jgi:hypothetical protein
MIDHAIRPSPSRNLETAPSMHLLLQRWLK